MGDTTYQQQKETFLQETKSLLEKGHQFSPLKLSLITPTILGYCHCPFESARATYFLARDLVVRLASEYCSVLEALKEDASNYANTACRDDGSPYNPNPFDVLTHLFEKTSPHSSTPPDSSSPSHPSTTSKTKSLADYLQGAFEHFKWVFDNESTGILRKYFSSESRQGGNC